MTTLNFRRRIFTVALGLGCLAATCQGGITVYKGEAGAASWASLAGAYTTVGFADVQMYEPIAFDRYADFGVLITDPETNVGWLYEGFANDGHGLSGDCVTEFTLTEPTLAFATRFPGELRAWVYSGDTLLGTSGNLGGGGDNFFAGITSDVAFDRIVFKGIGPAPPLPCDEIFFDDIYFSTVPTPGALPLLSAIVVASRRRRLRG